ncbi:hypothetical protein [Butyrivibrio sp. MC2013]|uniref:hypothetical protein n=1 Tax=Butyrivibrio sp. MC2013 TaxID=1280686 RepID=UPI00040A8E00|nr:hypothetical protein [Butyrivibrio sp. MC2013]
MIDAYETERREKIVTVWNVITAFVMLSQVGAIILRHTNVISPKIMFMLLGTLPWIRFIYALIFSDITVWNEYNRRKSEHQVRKTKEWKRTHICFFTGYAFIVQDIIFIYDIFAMMMEIQIHKGYKVLLMIWLAVLVLMLLIGYMRISDDEKKLQMGYYGVLMAIFIGLTVNTSCYYLSSAPRYEKCSYLSRSYSKSRKGPATYYVTVELADGSTAESEVSSSLYKAASYTDLVASISDGPFGIEYLRVHELTPHYDWGEVLKNRIESIKNE